jgi:inorganic phosphate transporter, PiT family
MLAILAAALIYDFINGIQGSANIVATMISSYVMRPRRALWLAAIGEGIGPFLFGVAVANTISGKFVEADAITPLTLFAGVLGAILWNGFTVYISVPSSASHALMGGLMGAALSQGGLSTLQMEGIITILIALFASPFIGLLVGFLLVRLIYFLCHHAPPRINQQFRRGQIFASFGLAMVFGSNDGQKVMGVITLGLVLTGEQNNYQVPLWVVASTAIVLALGTLLGGDRVIRTMGTKFFKIRPVHGLASQTSSTLVILIAGLLGGPVSTTQVVSSSIVGAGSADRISKIRWQVFDRIGVAWYVTIPASAAAGALVFWILEKVG